MFWRVALITFANVLVKNQILLKNKQMIFRHLTFTFHFHFPEHPLRVFKKNHPSGVLLSRKLLLSSSTPHLHLRISQGPTKIAITIQIDFSPQISK